MTFYIPLQLLNVITAEIYILLNTKSCTMKTWKKMTRDMLKTKINELVNEHVKKTNKKYERERKGKKV